MAVFRTAITIIIFLISFATQAKSHPVVPEPSVWLYNQTQNQVVHEQNAQQIRPFASITKLMTAMIAVDQDRDFARKLPLSKLVGSYLPPGEYTRHDLLNAMLVKSDNAAAETFAADYPGGRDAFLQAMNQRAQKLGMTSTQFHDPSGLSQGNTGNAGDLAKLVRAAGEYETIRNASTQKRVTVETQHKKRKRSLELSNTNRNALMLFNNIRVSKSGFTNPAGFCMVLQIESQGQLYNVVVLGAKNPAKRLDLVKNMLYNHIAEVGNAKNSNPDRRSWRH